MFHFVIHPSYLPIKILFTDLYFSDKPVRALLHIALLSVFPEAYTYLLFSYPLFTFNSVLHVEFFLYLVLFSGFGNFLAFLLIGTPFLIFRPRNFKYFIGFPKSLFYFIYGIIGFYLYLAILLSNGCILQLLVDYLLFNHVPAICPLPLFYGSQTCGLGDRNLEEEFS